MTATSYSRLAGAIFALVALLQLIRAVAGWPVTVSGTTIPLWASWVACVVGRRAGVARVHCVSGLGAQCGAPASSQERQWHQHLLAAPSQVRLRGPRLVGCRDGR
jgi:hypothetical protein